MSERGSFVHGDSELVQGSGELALCGGEFMFERGKLVLGGGELMLDDEDHLSFVRLSTNTPHAVW